MTLICVGKLTIIGSDNGLSPGRRQAIIWTNAEILLIRTIGTNFSEILGEIHSFSFKKCIWKCRLRKGVFLVSASMSKWLTTRLAETNVQMWKQMWERNVRHVWWIYFHISVVIGAIERGLHNTLRPTQYGRRFADDTFKHIFLNENVRILIKISLKFVPKGTINNSQALVQIMAWCRSGDKPLSEPKMVSLVTHICVTRPQWVKWEQIRWQVIILQWKPGQVNDGLSNAVWWNVKQFKPIIFQLVWYWKQLLHRTQLHSNVSNTK